VCMYVCVCVCLCAFLCLCLCPCLSLSPSLSLSLPTFAGVGDGKGVEAARDLSNAHSLQRLDCCEQAVFLAQPPVFLKAAGKQLRVGDRQTERETHKHRHRVMMGICKRCVCCEERRGKQRQRDIPRLRQTAGRWSGCREIWTPAICGECESINDRRRKTHTNTERICKKAKTLLCDKQADNKQTNRQKAYVEEMILFSAGALDDRLSGDPSCRRQKNSQQK
jgi:hypothetical protein